MIFTNIEKFIKRPEDHTVLVILKELLSIGNWVQDRRKAQHCVVKDTETQSYRVRARKLWEKIKLFLSLKNKNKLWARISSMKQARPRFKDMMKMLTSFHFYIFR